MFFLFVFNLFLVEYAVYTMIEEKNEKRKKNVRRQYMNSNVTHGIDTDP